MQNSPLLSRERTQSCLNVVKATNAGEGASGRHPSQPSCLLAVNEPSDFAYAKSFALCRQAASLNREGVRSVVRSTLSSRPLGER